MSLMRMKLPVAECLMNARSWPIARLAASGRNVIFQESRPSHLQCNRSSSTHCGRSGAGTGWLIDYGWGLGDHRRPSWIRGLGGTRLETIVPVTADLQVFAPSLPPEKFPEHIRRIRRPDASRFRSWRQSPICSGSFCCHCGVMLFVVQMHISAFHLSCADQVSRPEGQ